MRPALWRLRCWLTRTFPITSRKWLRTRSSGPSRARLRSKSSHLTSRSPMSVDLAILEKALGHCFRDRELLERALTHKSRVYEKPAEVETAADNEQLEFLGDAIL